MLLQFYWPWVCSLLKLSYTLLFDTRFKQNIYDLPSLCDEKLVWLNNTWQDQWVSSHTNVFVYTFLARLTYRHTCVPTNLTTTLSARCKIGIVHFFILTKYITTPRSMDPALISGKSSVTSEQIRKKYHLFWIRFIKEILQQTSKFERKLMLQNSFLHSFLREYATVSLIMSMFP